MPKIKKLSWTDHEILLEYLVDHTIKQTAAHFGLSEGAVRHRLFSIRQRLTEEKKAINRIKKLQMISDRVKKFTLTGALLEDEAEE
jgi:hypothetical protein